MTPIQTEFNNISDEPLVNPENEVIFFLVLSLLLGLLVGSFKKYKVPYTPTLFIIGIVCGKYPQIFGENSIIAQSILIATKVDPHGALQIFLPILIFEAGFNTEWHAFKYQIVPMMTVAVLCVIVNSFYIMLCIKYILGYGDDYYTWPGAFMFGGIISMTDCVAIVAVLKEVGVSKKLKVLIEGESMVNDCTGFIIYQIAIVIEKGGNMTISSCSYLLASLSMGALITGCSIGFIGSVYIKWVFNDKIQVINTSFISGFIAWFAAETLAPMYGLHISGLVTLVALGLFMSAQGNFQVNPDVTHTLHAFWHQIVWSSETIVFVMGGVIVGHTVLNDDTGYIQTSDYYKLIGMYICLIVMRALSILTFQPLVFNYGYKINWNEFWFIVWSGMRGAICMIFAMIAASDPGLNPKFRNIFIFDMGGMVIATLLINAPTCTFVMKQLGLLDGVQSKDKFFKMFVENMIHSSDDHIKILQEDKYLVYSDWEKVKQYSGYSEFVKISENLELSIIESQKRENNENKSVELTEMNDYSDISEGLFDMNQNDLNSLQEARNRLLTAMKGCFYSLFQKNQCDPNSLQVLMNVANWDSDNTDKPFQSWANIERTFFVYQHFRQIHQLKQIPLIGNQIAIYITQNIYSAYNISSCYVDALDDTLHLLKDMHINEKFKEIMAGELEQMKGYAETYIRDVIINSHPEVAEFIQSRKAATNILELQKVSLQKGYQYGKVELKQYIKIKKIIDQKQVELSNLQPSWELDTFKAEQENFELCKMIKKHMPKYTLEELYEGSEEVVFDKDFRITRAKEFGQYFYLILRGFGQETSCDLNLYQKSKKKGEAISLLNLVSKDKNYSSNFICDSQMNVRQFNLNDIRQLIRHNFELEKYVWTNCLYDLFRSTYAFNKLANILPTQFKQFIQFCTFNKTAPGQSIDFKHGGIFLRGKAQEYIGELDIHNYDFLRQYRFGDEENNLIFKENLEFFEDEMKVIYSNQISYQDYKFVKPNVKLVAIQPCEVFLFTCQEEIQEIFETLAKQS